MIESILYKGPNFKGILRVKESNSRSHLGYLQYVEVEKDGSEKVVYESEELYTAYEEGVADILGAVKRFYNSVPTKTWINRVQIEDDLHGSYIYEGIIQGLLNFCLSL